GFGGGSRPVGGGMPAFNRTPSFNMPAARPQLPAARPNLPQRPGTLPGTAPGNRPALPTGGNRPNLPRNIRPAPRPGVPRRIPPGGADLVNRPGWANRPPAWAYRPGWAYHRGWINGYWHGQNNANWWNNWGGFATGLAIGGIGAWGIGSSLWNWGYMPYSNP